MSNGVIPDFALARAGFCTWSFDFENLYRSELTVKLEKNCSNPFPIPTASAPAVEKSGTFFRLTPPVGINGICAERNKIPTADSF